MNLRTYEPSDLWAVTKYYAVKNPAMTLYLPVRWRSVDLRSSYGE